MSLIEMSLVKLAYLRRPLYRKATYTRFNFVYVAHKNVTLCTRATVVVNCKELGSCKEASSNNYWPMLHKLDFIFHLPALKLPMLQVQFKFQFVVDITRSLPALPPCVGGPVLILLKLTEKVTLGLRTEGSDWVSGSPNTTSDREGMDTQSRPVNRHEQLRALSMH